MKVLKCRRWKIEQRTNFQIIVVVDNYKRSRTFNDVAFLDLMVQIQTGHDNT
jgi:hypothetical protein